MSDQRKRPRLDLNAPDSDPQDPDLALALELQRQFDQEERNARTRQAEADAALALQLSQAAPPPPLPPFQPVQAGGSSSASSASSASPAAPASSTAGKDWPPTEFDGRGFFLTKVPNLPTTHSLGLSDLLQGGELDRIILFNYMIDVDWLLTAVPGLLTARRGLKLLHGLTGESATKVHSEAAAWNRKLAAAGRDGNYVQVLPQVLLPSNFSVHHTKLKLLYFSRRTPARPGADTGGFLRVVIGTANLIECDWVFKSQGLWVQDFPLRPDCASSVFRQDLADYLDAYVERGAGTRRLLPAESLRLKDYDMSRAAAVLLPSVPGRHQAPKLHRYGQLKLRQALQNFGLKDAPGGDVVAQASSIGSLTPRFLRSLVDSCLGRPLLGSSSSNSNTRKRGHSQAQAGWAEGAADDKDRLPLRMIWPTVEDVRTSQEGYIAGGSIPFSSKNAEHAKDFMRPYWHKWDARASGRQRCMPHIKSYSRLAPPGVGAGDPSRSQEPALLWVALTSANLSRAAWGELQKLETQLHILHFELGVLLIPDLVQAARGRNAPRVCLQPAFYPGGALQLRGLPQQQQQQQQSAAGFAGGSRGYRLGGGGGGGSGDAGGAADEAKVDDREQEQERRRQDGPPEVIQIPLPYDAVDPKPYGPQDEPWVWDADYQKPDTWGFTHTRSSRQ